MDVHEDADYGINPKRPAAKLKQVIFSSKILSPCFSWNNMHGLIILNTEKLNFKRIHTLFLECHEIHLPCFEPYIYENHMITAICVPANLQKLGANKISGIEYYILVRKNLHSTSKHLLWWNQDGAQGNRIFVWNS
jgi:hypothetical protein